MNDENNDPDGSFVRRKAKVKLGDGPDQRGEVTVELVGDPENLDGSFADWQIEVDRAVQVLRDQLRLNADDGGDTS